MVVGWEVPLADTAKVFGVIIELHLRVTLGDDRPVKIGRSVESNGGVSKEFVTSLDVLDNFDVQ